MKTRRSGSRLAVAMLALGWVALLVPPVSAASGPDPQPPATEAPAAPPPVTPSPDVPIGDDGDPLYQGTDPNRHLKAYAPFSVVEYPREVDARARGVKLTPTHLELVEGGRLVRKVPFDASQPVAFEAIALAVGDRTWIAETGSGVFGLRAAFVQDTGTTVRFAAPGTTELRLATDPPGVFVGGEGPSTTARFEGVKVTSWDLARKAPSQDVDAVRPFVLYAEGSRADIVHSEFAYLGSDRTGAYGVSFRKGGTTGEVTDSVFHDCFFGVYTYQARDLVFRRNVFRDNLFYGLDPHDYTTGIVAEDNEAYGNGTHGIVFSAEVTGGTVRNNYSHDNGQNGIVMDRRSDHNVITGNRVEHNGRDGIVLLGSSDNVVEDNVVTGHRTGVRTNQLAARNVIRHNRIEGNQVGVEAYGGASELTVEDNQVVGNSRAGIILEAPLSAVDGGKVGGGINGIDIRSANAVISGVTIEAVDIGVVVRPKASAGLAQVSVRARRVGIQADPGGVVSVRGSNVKAATPIRGPVESVAENRFIEPRFLHRAPWLAVAGVLALACAIVLELLQLVRERKGRSSGAWTTA
jgi:parallel beta-helix repeat protein